MFFSLSWFLRINTNNVFAEENKPTTTEAGWTWNQTLCQACDKSSPYLERYINFSKDVIKVMQDYANSESSVFSTKKNPTYWSSNESNDDTELLRVLQSITDSINKKWDVALSTAYLWIFTSLEMAGNARYSMGILGSSKSLTRDRNKLEDIQQNTLNVVTDLWNAGVFVRLWFKEWLEEALQKIFEKYSKWDESLFEIDKTAKVTTQPIVIFTDLWAMTNFLKYWLYDSTVLFKNSNIMMKFMSEEKYMWNSLSVSSWFIENMINYYSCAKWIVWVAKCASTWENNIVGSSIGRFKSVADNGKKEAWTAIDVFKTARKRLSWFRSKNSDAEEALKNREYELLRWQYGRRAANPWIIKQAVDGRKKGRKTTKQGYVSTVSTIEWVFHSRGEKTKKITIGDQQIETIKDLEKETFNKIAVDTAKEANQSRHESEYGNPWAITKLFPILTQNIIAQKLLIDGKWDKNTIYENVRSACLNQCTNVPWKKCSYEE